MPWDLCPGSAVYRYSYTPTKPGEVSNEAKRTSEAGVYFDLETGTVWEVTAWDSQNSIYITAVSVNAHPEIMDQIDLSKAEIEFSMKFLEMAALSEGPGDLASQMEQLPKRVRDGILNTFVNTARLIDVLEVTRRHFEMRTIHGEAARVLAYHGVYCEGAG